MAVPSYAALLTSRSRAISCRSSLRFRPDSTIVFIPNVATYTMPHVMNSFEMVLSQNAYHSLEA